jgi:2,4-didehydro-3-deoxy-L-rhamnonate hydrolase
MSDQPAMPNSWSLITYGTAEDQRERAGILRADDTVCAVPELSDYPGVTPALEDWDDISDRLRDLDPMCCRPVSDARIAAPLRGPTKILAAGANYWSHLREMGGDAEPETLGDPFFFLLPASALVGPDQPIEIPTDEHANVDWEGELAVVIGRRARNVSAAEADNYVAGYTICNDVSARGLHRRASFLAPPFEWDWLNSKGRDTFLPHGPGVTPHWFVDDPDNLRLRLWVNGVLKQDARTSDLIVDISHLIAAASRLLTLEPGDMLTTGTPSGVGASNGEFLRSGDIVTVEIESLGRLVNPVVSEPTGRLESPPSADGAGASRL